MRVMPPKYNRAGPFSRSGPVVPSGAAYRRLPGSSRPGRWFPGSPAGPSVPRAGSPCISESKLEVARSYGRLAFEVRQPSDQGQQGRPVALRRGVDEVPGGFLRPVHAVPVRGDTLPHEQIPAFLGVGSSGSITSQNNVSRRSRRWKHASSSTAVCGSIQPSRVRASAHSSRPERSSARRAVPA